MDIVEPQIDDYLARTLVAGHPILQEMADYGYSRDFPIVGPQVGRLLNILALSIHAKRVLELGSGFGYSAMWFALAVGPGGEVVMTDHSKENVDMAHDYFTRAGLYNRVVPNIGNALDIARRTPGPFDVVFCDISKDDYPAAFGIARDKLRVGGYFICDNMLRDGKVLKDKDPMTQGVLNLSRQLMESKDFATTIVPLRDGVSISLRIS